MSSTTRLSRNGVASFLPTPCALGFRHRLGDALLDHRLFERVSLGHRIGDQEAAGADLALQADHAGEIVQAVAAVLDLEAGRAGVEGRELVAAVADDRHALRLQEFERLLDVEDRLRPGADDGDAGAREFDEVGRDVEGLLRPAMDAADAAGGENLDAGEAGDEHGRGDRRAGRLPRRAATAARSRREAFTTPPVSWARPSISCRSRPTRKRPLITAIVAGVAPVARTASSTACAVSTLRGYGMPWVMMVDSSATSGLPLARASATSGE